MTVSATLGKSTRISKKRTGVAEPESQHPIRREGDHVIGFITNARDSDACYAIYDLDRALLGWAKEYDCAQVYLHEFADGKAPRLVPIGYSDTMKIINQEISEVTKVIYEPTPRDYKLKTISRPAAEVGAHVEVLRAFVEKELKRRVGDNGAAHLEKFQATFELRP